MKKFYVFLFFAAFTTGLMAQVEVTFSVDLNTEGASTDGVFVTGNWMGAAGLGGDWQEPSTNTDAQLLDADDDGVFTLTVTMAAGDYEYKYANGSGWPNAEAGGDSDNYQADLSACGGIGNGYGGFNRGLSVPNEAAYTVTTYEFNTCTESPLTNTNELTTIQDVKITPNPTSGLSVVTFANPNNANHNIMVTSITGQVAQQFQNVTGTSLEINTQNLTAGMYFVTFQNDLGEVGSEKLIVQ